MAFFRIKNIKGKEYVYRVENKWKSSSSRQKVKSYLGRAYRFNIKNDLGFGDFYKISDLDRYVQENDNKNIISNLVGWELFRHAVPKEEFMVDIQNRIVQKNGKNIVIVLNDGFMCGFTLSNLLDFQAESEEQDGNRLARAFIEAGVKIPEEIFIGLFTKLHKLS